MKQIIYFLFLLISIPAIGQTTHMCTELESEKEADLWWLSYCNDKKPSKRAVKEANKLQTEEAWGIVGSSISLAKALEHSWNIQYAGNFNDDGSESNTYIWATGYGNTTVSAKSWALSRVLGSGYSKLGGLGSYQKYRDLRDASTVFIDNIFAERDEYVLLELEWLGSFNEKYSNNKVFKKLIDENIIEDYIMVLERDANLFEKAVKFQEKKGYGIKLKKEDKQVTIFVQIDSLENRVNRYLRADFANFLNDSLGKWQKKGVYETSQAYTKRVNDVSYKQKTANLINEYANEHLALNIDTPDEFYYDADNEIYKLNVKHLNPVFFNIPVTEVASMHSNIQAEKGIWYEHQDSILIIKNLKFTLSDKNNFIISEVEVTNPSNGISYKFDIKTDYKFSNYKNEFVAKTITYENQSNTIDNTAPEITIISPALQSTRGLKPVSNANKQITIIGKATDKSGVFEVLVNGTNADLSKNGNFTAKVNLLPGENEIIIKATDIKKNTATKIYTIIREDKQIVAKKDELDIGKFYALIIGVQDYRDPSINDLDQPVSDAKSLYNILVNNYTFEAQNIKLLKNPSKDEIAQSLDYYADNINKNDNLLIFYAGHGYWDEKFKQGYWLASDADRNKRSTWFSNGIIRDYMQGIPAKHTLLITDACFGGGIFKSRDAFANATVAVKQLYNLPSRKAMTSGALSEVPDNSVFIQYLVKRLTQNEEKYLSSEQLFASFKIAVINNSENGQVPQFGEVKSTGDEGGDFIFIRK